MRGYEYHNKMISIKNNPKQQTLDPLDQTVDRNDVFREIQRSDIMSL